MPNNEQVPVMDKDEGLLELVGWLHSEIQGIRTELRHWARGCNSDKAHCYGVYTGLSNLEEMVKAFTSQPVRDQLRKDLHQRDQATSDDIPF
jgi:hypothetical protein